MRVKLPEEMKNKPPNVLRGINMELLHNKQSQMRNSNKL